ncbi:MAG: hypothetical protein Q4D66_05405 [Bacteroidales bacterium]|nr:hypothetical protein [Bacteroidales bacterium]
MKKFAFLLLSYFFLATPFLLAQQRNMFNHLGIGLSVGSDGIGLEASTPIGRYVQARTGLNFLPKTSYYKGQVSYGIQQGGLTMDDKIDISATLNIMDWKVLVDLYPSTKTTFRFTTGFYVGQRALISAETSPNKLLRYGGYIVIGGQTFGANQAGVVPLELRTNVLKPYLGIGFGRAVPHKHRLALSFDLGVQFLGSPRVYGWSEDILNYGFREIKYQEIDINGVAKDAREAIKKVNEIEVYPVLSLRLCGRIF